METTCSPAHSTQCQSSNDRENDTNTGSSNNGDHSLPRPRRKEFKKDEMERFSTVSLELEILDNSLTFNESFDSDEAGDEMHQLLAEDHDNNKNYKKIDSTESLQPTANYSKGISFTSGSPSSPLSNSIGDDKKFDAQAYLDKRVMTPMQERVNALTILPNLFYCIYFVLAGCWLSSEELENARHSVADEPDISISTEQDGWTDMAQDVFGHQNDFLNHIG